MFCIIIFYDWLLKLNIAFGYNLPQQIIFFKILKIVVKYFAIIKNPAVKTIQINIYKVKA